jgi:hypothetical protein
MINYSLLLAFLLALLFMEITKEHRQTFLQVQLYSSWRSTSSKHV